MPVTDQSHGAPTIWVGGLRIAGEKQPVSELGDAEISRGELGHTQNNFQIDFFGLDFRAGESLRYQFMLEGADSSWSVPTELRTVTYANLIKFFRESHSAERSDYDLTPHETRLLKLLTEGYNYTTAAEKLGVSYNTIKFHVRHIFDKLQVHSKSEAVVKAMRDRLV